MNDMPIGFYDSGVGGISVLRETIRLLPHENFIYYGDNANAPYGTKSEAEVKDLSLRCGDFLYAKGVKAVVIACNTATSIVVQTMRANYNMPIISMEPAVKPAAEKYKQGDIAVMATPATLHQKRYRALIERLKIEDRVRNVECGKLASLIEKGNLQSPLIKAHICDTLFPLREREVCAVVIGCTHYSFVADQIADVAHKLLRGNCEVFDGMYGTARHIQRVLEQEDLVSGRTGDGKVDFYSSNGQDSVDLMRRFMRL